MDSQNNNNLSNQEVKTTEENSLPISTSSDNITSHPTSRVSEATVLGPKEPERRKKKSTSLIVVLLIIIAIALISIYVVPNIIEKLGDNTDEEVAEEETEVIETVIVFGDEVKITGTGATVDNGNVTITNAGTYRISGETSNGSVTVNAPLKEVNLVLDQATIKCETDAAIKVLDASLVKITLSDETVNYVQDGGNSEYDAAIFSNSDLVIEGTGILDVIGKVEKGIATETSDITINSGKIIILSPDDGINAGGDGGVITINGGTFYIHSLGDGIDSNKDIIINDGTIYVMGSTSSDNAGIDSDGLYQINGGTVIGLGNGMMSSPDDNSTQKTILFNLTSELPADSTVALTDVKGNEVISFIINRSVKTITISTPDITNGIYNLYYGVKHEGTLNYGIYTKDIITLGTKVTINSVSDFTISKTNNWFGNIDNAPSEDIRP